MEFDAQIQLQIKVSKKRRREPPQSTYIQSGLSDCPVSPLYSTSLGTQRCTGYSIVIPAVYPQLDDILPGN